MLLPTCSNGIDPAHGPGKTANGVNNAHVTAAGPVNRRSVPLDGARPRMAGGAGHCRP
jgi:hypothetical protein